MYEIKHKNGLDCDLRGRIKGNAEALHHVSLQACIMDHIALSN